MTRQLGNRFTRYVPTNISHGVIQSNYFKIKNFLFFNSSTSNSQYSDLNAVLYELNHWKSIDTPNPFFIVSLNKHLLKLSSISMKSCNHNECSYKLDVYGSNKGSQWEFACSIRGHETMFKTNVNNTKCESKYKYKQYKIVHIGPNSSNTNVFPIFFLELFGDLYDAETRTIPLFLRRECSIVFHYFITFLLYNS